MSCWIRPCPSGPAICSHGGQPTAPGSQLVLQQIAFRGSYSDYPWIFHELIQTFMVCDFLEIQERLLLTRRAQSLCEELSFPGNCSSLLCSGLILRLSKALIALGQNVRKKFWSIRWSSNYLMGLDWTQYFSWKKVLHLHIIAII